MPDLYFEWDEWKETENFIKHKLSFAESVYIFRDQRILTVYEEENSDAEDRWISIGLSRNGLLVVVHTHRISEGKETIRIISARKANKAETIQYNAKG
jgi:hypothetical protein